MGTEKLMNLVSELKEEAEDLRCEYGLEHAPSVMDEAAKEIEKFVMGEVKISKKESKKVCYNEIKRLKKRAKYYRKVAEEREKEINEKDSEIETLKKQIQELEQNLKIETKIHMEYVRKVSKLSAFCADKIARIKADNLYSKAKERAQKEIKELDVFVDTEKVELKVKGILDEWFRIIYINFYIISSYGYYG